MISCYKSEYGSRLYMPEKFLHFYCWGRFIEYSLAVTCVFLHSNAYPLSLNFRIIQKSYPRQFIKKHVPIQIIFFSYNLIVVSKRFKC